jgi:hypothetical protein
MATRVDIPMRRSEGVGMLFTTWWMHKNIDLVGFR